MGQTPARLFCLRQFLHVYVLQTVIFRAKELPSLSDQLCLIARGHQGQTVKEGGGSLDPYNSSHLPCVCNSALSAYLRVSIAACDKLHNQKAT